MGSDFWEKMQELGDGGRKCYVYRIWPAIDRRDQDHYIGKLTEQFDEDFLMRTYGSGKYHLRLHDAKGRPLGSQTVAIHNQDYPPKVDPREVTTDPINDVYREVWLKPEAETDNEQRAAPASGEDSAVSAAVRELARIVDRMQDHKEAVSTDEREMLKTGALTAIDMIKQQQSHNPQGIDAAQLVELALKLNQLQARPSESSDSSAVVQLVTSQLETQSRILTELIAQRGEREQSGSGIGQMGEMIALIKAMREEFGQPTPREEKQEWWEKLAPHVPETLNSLAALGSAKAALAGAVAKAPTPAPIAPAQPTPSEAKSAEDAPGADSQTHQTQQPDQLGQFLSAIAGPMLNYLNQGAPDGEFAGWLADGFGEGTYLQIRSLGKDTLIQALQSYPALWQQLEPFGPRLEQFINEFVAGPVDDEPEPNAPESAPATPPKDPSEVQ